MWQEGMVWLAGQLFDGPHDGFLKGRKAKGSVAAGLHLIEQGFKLYSLSLQRVVQRLLVVSERAVLGAETRYDLINRC